MAETREVTEAPFQEPLSQITVSNMPAGNDSPRVNVGLWLLAHPHLEALQWWSSLLQQGALSPGQKKVFLCLYFLLVQV